MIIPDDFIRRMFILSNLNENDIFYHLGIGNNPSSLVIAKGEFNVKKAVGIDIDPIILEDISSKTSSIEDIFLVVGDATKNGSERPGFPVWQPLWVKFAAVGFAPDHPIG